jgi:hypothetical protein
MQKPSQPKDHQHTLVIACVFVLTLLCAAGAVALAFFGPNPLTDTQQKVFEMFNSGWMIGLGTLAGLRGVDRRQF